MKDLGRCPVCGNLIQKYQRVCCSVPCAREYRSRGSRGDGNPDWKGGRYIEPAKGYVLVRQPSHPRARANGYVLEHLLVAETMLGRPLTATERVHHLNHNPADNRPDNLRIYGTNAEHLVAEGHHRQKAQPCLCGQPAVARGLCSRHYAQVRRTGRILDRG